MREDLGNFLLIHPTKNGHFYIICKRCDPHWAEPAAIMLSERVLKIRNNCPHKVPDSIVLYAKMKAIKL
jgi:hypothetical protein